MPATLTQTSLNTPVIRRLDNGLTIVAEQMPVDAVNLNVWLNVGSICETDEINGMAHFLEHMVFKGTPKLESGEFERAIEERGAATNAATSQEYTHYYITTAPKDFADLAPLQLEVVLNPSLADRPFERERMVILEEIRRSQDNPSRRTYARAMKTCFERLPYRRPVLGLTDTIERLSAAQMREFHRHWYAPENITAAVVGNLPVEELLDIVAQACDRAYSHQSDRAVPISPSFHPEPIFTEVVRHEERDPQLQQSRLVMLWRVPGKGELETSYALDVLAAILGQGRMSRLFRDLREERKLVSSIGTSNITQGIQGVFYIAAQLPEKNIAEVESAILEHLRRFREEPVDPAELFRIRAQVANRFVFANERPSDRANLYGYYQSQMGTLSPALTYPDRLRAIEAEDIQKVAREYLNPEAYGAVVMKEKHS
ncbi:MAG: insulinase family protein [Cyanobacteria bacterium SBLK]|nr:insulinase family protein [Cyanobacteria bacterium SBLK]